MGVRVCSRVVRASSSVPASGGLWQVLSSQEAVSLVGAALETPGRTVHDAACALACLASERWERDGPFADDITIVIIQLDARRLRRRPASEFV